MAESRPADMVLSLTGRDRGQLMLVVAEEGDFLLLANGARAEPKTRKRKRRKHVSLQGPSDGVRQRKAGVRPLTNSEIRGARPLTGTRTQLTEEDKPQWQKDDVIELEGTESLEALPMQCFR